MTRKTRQALILLAIAATAVVAVAGVMFSRRGAETAAPPAETTPAAATGDSAPAPTTTAPTRAAGPSGTAAATTSATHAGPTDVVATTSTPGGTARPVSVALGYADWDAANSVVEAAGFVTDVVEDGGTCTLTLTKGTATVTATRTGAADATTTNCGRLTVPGASVLPGAWQVSLTYRSATSFGTSAALTVQVPTR
jgi:hypothetical protein